MLSFECDYNNGAHPKVLQHLIDTNSLTSLTYGFDEWSESARRKIREACGCPDADVYFLSGGTQANATIIDSCLATCEAVVSAETGHINVHEAGAVEASGHRVIGLPSTNGKLLPKTLADYLNVYEHDESRDHVAQPGMVYITYPTEMGTLYTAEEITAIQQLCRRYGLQLFVDGARLGYGLMSSASDISLQWLARHCDVFYIGGTKVGALCGEAVVFPRGNAPKYFFSNVKRHGALLAKGRVVGVQFDALFSENLYFDISRHAILMAEKLKRILEEAGMVFYMDSPTNQQFILLPHDRALELKKIVDFTLWGPSPDDPTLMICRFVTSWATTEQDLENLRKLL
ncbi:MAG: aminotransferase class V-fold PLP-dependent enzyme [Prevotella sp.]|nr:aminotransferase class V-fold PLP-dependent enzyme [Prevotella sp.]